MDGRSVTSFTSLFIIPSPGLLKLVGFTEDHLPIVEVDSPNRMAHSLQVYEPISEQFQALGIEADAGSFYIGPYKESLILVTHPDRFHFVYMSANYITCVSNCCKLRLVKTERFCTTIQHI